ncbi:hypothetical protein HY797_01025 [Candidatus Falkowbacteria bacterium]|nr:hypothetical protein [Candidatus Falkowbacteria bacterium]
MERWELEYLEKKFKTKVFNIHSKNEEHCFPGFAENFSGFLHKTYIENMNDNVPEEEELSRFGGLCIDFSHWQDGILLGNQDFNKKMKEAAKNFPVGCSHISGVGREMIETRDVVFPEIVYRGHAKHFFDNLKELDYIENFLEFLPDLISLELENSFAEQLKAKAYLEKIIFHK